MSNNPIFYILSNLWQSGVELSILRVVALIACIYLREINFHMLAKVKACETITEDSLLLMWDFITQSNEQ